MATPAKSDVLEALERLLEAEALVTTMIHERAPNLGAELVQALIRLEVAGDRARRLIETGDMNGGRDTDETVDARRERSLEALQVRDRRWRRPPAPPGGGASSLILRNSSRCPESRQRRGFGDASAKA